jgi:phosphoribosylanthranilate isomerase
MTKANQVADAVSFGVDAIGVILHANSPRTISLADARAIRAVVPAFVSLVGVFVDADKDCIERAISVLKLDLIQLHGDESDELGDSVSRPYIKAIRAKKSEQVINDIEKFPNASAILLDPYVQGQHGGTGTTLNKQLWPLSLTNENLPTTEAKPLILAGGLSAENVGDRISQLAPFAVDMNSGLEDSPGDKNSQLMRLAIGAVRRADSISSGLML